MPADTRITSSPQEQIERLREQLDSQTRRLESLTSSEEVFRHFFEKSPIMIYATDRDGVFLNINQSGVELMGFQSKEEVIGVNIDTFFFIDPADRRNYLNILRRDGRMGDFETRMRRSDGSLLHVQMTAAERKTLSGKIKGFEGFVFDISDKKNAEERLRQSEEKYRTVLENSLAAIYMFQEGGHFSYVNQRFVTMLGYAHQNEILGRPFWEFIAPQDRQVVKKRGLMREKDEIYPRRYVFRMFKKDGSTLWVDMQAAHASYLGSPAVVGNFIDITKWREAEQEVRHLSRQLIQGIEEERRHLAADLHDEFGQALTLLQFDLEALQSSLPEGSREPAAICTRVGERIQQLADSVRKTTSILRPDLLDTLGLIPAVEGYVQDLTNRGACPVIEFQAVGLKRRLDADLELVFYRIVQESLTNAIKHAEARRVDITLTYSHPTVILLIADDGKGFDSDRDPSALTNCEQQGIGLLSMKERVAAIGGNFQLLSATGRGTRLRVEISLKQRPKQ